MTLAERLLTEDNARDVGLDESFSAALDQAREITKKIKWGESPQTIVNEILALGASVGLSEEAFRFEISDVTEAANALEQAIYKLEDPIEEARYKAEDYLDSEY